MIDRSRKFFAFDGVDLRYFTTHQQARDFAQNALDGYKEDASTSDGWDDAALGICVGIVCEDVQTIERRDVTPDERKDVDDNIGWIEERELVGRDTGIPLPWPDAGKEYGSGKEIRELRALAESSRDPIVCELTIEQLREKAKRSRNTGEFYDGY